MQLNGWKIRVYTGNSDSAVGGESQASDQSAMANKRVDFAASRSVPNDELPVSRA